MKDANTVKVEFLFGYAASSPRDFPLPKVGDLLDPSEMGNDNLVVTKITPNDCCPHCYSVVDKRRVPDCITVYAVYLDVPSTIASATK